MTLKTYDEITKHITAMRQNDDTLKKLTTGKITTISISDDGVTTTIRLDSEAFKMTQLALLTLCRSRKAKFEKKLDSIGKDKS